MDGDFMPGVSEKERSDIQVATIYDIRLQLKNDERTNFTKEDILELLDTIASEKAQK